MIIQHNMMALNSYNRLSGNNTLVSKNLEKLSSGFKINRAGDDAAGLAISEKMRAQITGLTRATQNSQDGISLVQTAEGQLTEVHSMLNRMVDLATQASNGTIDNDVDRKNLQKEVQSLKDEIDRIATSSHFNGIKLLDGSLGGGRTGAVAVSTDVFGATIGTTAATAPKFDGTALTHGTNATASELKVTYTDASGASKDVTLSYTSGTDAATSFTALKTAFDQSELAGMFELTGAAADFDITSKTSGTTAPAVTALTGKNNTVANGSATAGTDSKTIVNLGAAAIATGQSVTVNGKTYTMAAATDADKNEFSSWADFKTQLEADGMVVGGTDFTDTTIAYDPTKVGAGLSLQIGDTADQRVTVKVANMNVASLGLGAVDVSTEPNATKSIDLVKEAINTVSSTRADLGAIQNRLEHTINNLTTTTENMTAAEARIRDTDMAKEMMAFTKNNVLAQAAQAMLAQANQQPQQVLQLLR